MPPSCFSFCPGINPFSACASSSVRGRFGFSSSFGFGSGGLANARSPGFCAGLVSGSGLGGRGSGFSAVSACGGSGCNVSTIFGTLSCAPSILDLFESTETSGLAASELAME